jgi:hypothetical protein
MWTAYIICQAPTVCMHASLPPPNSRCDSRRMRCTPTPLWHMWRSRRKHHACISLDEARCTHMHGAGLASPGTLQQLQRAQLQRLLNSRHTQAHTLLPPHAARSLKGRTSRSGQYRPSYRKEEHCKRKQARTAISEADEKTGRTAINKPAPRQEPKNTRSLHHNPTTVIGRCTKDLTQDPTPLGRFYQTQLILAELKLLHGTSTTQPLYPTHTHTPCCLYTSCQSNHA